MIQYQIGQRVQFNVEFSRGDVFVPIDAEGVVRSISGESVFVVCQEIVWMCHWFEVRPKGTEITAEMGRLTAAYEKLLADYATWEAGSVSA